MKKSVIILVVLAVSAFGLRAAGAHDGPAPPPPQCVGAAIAVLVDASSEPDLYAAFLLAGVLGTECIVDAGDRDGPLPNASRRLLAEPTLADGYAVGGQAAVPPDKLVAGLSWRRAGGVDRWETLRIIGAAAANPPTLPQAAAASSGTAEQTQSDTPSGASCTHWHAGHPKHTHYAGETGKHTHQSSSRTKCGWLF